MESRREIHERRITNWTKHVDSARESSRYSSDRFDILIISLSTTALLFSIGFINDIIPNLNATNTALLKTSWLLFVFSIISNLISQITGYYANQYDIRVARNLIREERGIEMKGDQVLFEKMHLWLNRMTIFLNGTSFVLLIGGIITIVLFFSNNI